MVPKKMVDICDGCGIDVTEKKTERILLSTAKSLPILTLRKAFLENLGGLGHCQLDTCAEIASLHTDGTQGQIQGQFVGFSRTRPPS